MSRTEEILGQPDLFDQRELCPDGTCVGVIGRDGVCTVCGRQGEGRRESWSSQEKERRADASEEPGDPKREDQGEPVSKDVEKPTQEHGDTPSFDPDRKLCPDGGCIGVIGADGRCKECGKSW